MVVQARTLQGNHSGRICTRVLMLVAWSCVGLAAGLAESRDEWRQVNADAAQSRWLPGTISPPLSVAWKQPLGKYHGVVAVATADRIFLVLTRVGDFRLGAFKAADGKMAWLSSAQFDPAFTDLPVLVPVVAMDGAVVFKSIAEQPRTRPDWPPFLALNTSDGSKRWGTPSDSRTKGAVCGVFRLQDGSLVATPLFIRGPESDHLLQLDWRTGRVLSSRSTSLREWKYWQPGGDPDTVWPAPGLEFHPLLAGQMPVPGGALFLFGKVWDGWDRRRTDAVATLAGASGPTLGLTFGHLPRPTGIGQLFWTAGVGAAGQTLYWDYYPLVEALDQQCHTLWKTMLPHPDGPVEYLHGDLDYAWLAPPLITPRRLVVFGWERIYGLDRESGKVRWELGSPGDPHPSMRSFNVGNHGVAPVGTGSIFYAVEFSPTMDPPNSVESDTLVAYKVQTGRKLWSMTLKGWDLGPRMIAHRGALYITGYNNRTRQNYLLKLAPHHASTRRTRQH